MLLPPSIESIERTIQYHRRHVRQGIFWSIVWLIVSSLMWCAAGFEAGSRHGGGAIGFTLASVGLSLAFILSVISMALSINDLRTCNARRQAVLNAQASYHHS